MASLRRSARRTARSAGKTLRSARRTAAIGSVAATAVARQVMAAVATRQPKTKKGKIALAIGLTAATILLKRKAAQARRAALEA